LLSRNNQIIEFNADKMPVGVAFKEEEPFTNHSIRVQDNDIFYLFSDGYKNQFGGPE
jgi:serine phosphatase RsbU (regulator of sigma subunit)